MLVVYRFLTIILAVIAPCRWPAVALRPKRGRVGMSRVDIDTLDLYCWLALDHARDLAWLMEWCSRVGSSDKT